MGFTKVLKTSAYSKRYQVTRRLNPAPGPACPHLKFAAAFRR